MPMRFAVSVVDDDDFKVTCEVMDCITVEKLKELVASYLRSLEAHEIVLVHDGIKLTGKHRIGFYGIRPGSLIKVPLQPLESHTRLIVMVFSTLSADPTPRDHIREAVQICR